MQKKQAKRGNRSVAAAPKVGKPSLSRRFLADFFGLEAKKLLFAVAEISYGDNEYMIKPVLAILGTDTYIDLLDGQCKKNVQAAGFKQDLYPAVVSYAQETETFVFKSSTCTKTEVSAACLKDNFGQSVVIDFVV